MKNRIFITMLLMPVVSIAQGYKTTNDVTVNAFTIVGAITLFFVLFYAIVSIESYKRQKHLFFIAHQGLIGWCVFLAIGIFILFAMLYNAELYSLIWLVSLILKIAVASFVSKEAQKLGRNKVLWWILGFLEFHMALIVLAISPKLIKCSNKNKSVVHGINNKYKTLCKNLKSLKKSGSLTPSEFRNKKQIIIDNYNSEIAQILDNEVVANDNQNYQKMIAQLEEAFKNGLLTEEEFETKKNDLKH